MRALATIAALLLPGLAAAQDSPHAGETFEIIRTSDTQQSSDGSTGTSHDRDTLVERVVAVSGAGLELEYDLPANTPADDRARDWKFPVRVFKPREGPLQLRNRAELEARVDKWLKAANLPRSACGRWYFSWNAFRIECDPEAALEAIRPFAIGQQSLGDGALYADERAARPVPLKRKPDGRGFAVEMAVDPAAVRNEMAEADLVVAEISGKKLTREAAQKAHVDDIISGTIRISFDTDTAGQALRRTRIVALTIRSAGKTETRKITEVIERRPVRPASNPDSI